MTEDHSYSKSRVIWILKNLIELRQGLWPEGAELLAIPGKSTGHNAYFESPGGMAAIVEMKLKMCGMDGTMAKVYYVLNEEDAVLSKIGRCRIDVVHNRIEKVIEYISGYPKKRSYEVFRWH